MDKMMMLTHMPAGFVAFGLVNGVFGFLFAAGIVLLFMWAWKHMSGAQMKQWGMWLAVIGVIGMLLGGIGSVAMIRHFGPGHSIFMDDNDDDRGMMNGQGSAGIMMKRVVKSAAAVKVP